MTLLLVSGVEMLVVAGVLILVYILGPESHTIARSLGEAIGNFQQAKDSVESDLEEMGEIKHELNQMTRVDKPMRDMKGDPIEDNQRELSVTSPESDPTRNSTSGGGLKGDRPRRSEQSSSTEGQAQEQNV